MTTQPLVSIIVPTFKNVKWLPQTIDSIINQKYDNYEIIVINDGSTENVNFFIEPYKNFKKFKFFEYSINRGASYARNIGISKCSGQYILPVDSDDVVCDSNWLNDCVKEIDEETIVTSLVCLCNKDMNPTGEIWPNNNVDKDWKTVIKTCNIIGPSMYSKSMWEKIGGYDEKILGYEDWDFWISAYKLGYKLKRIDHVYYHYRKHEDSSNLLQFKKKEIIFKYIENKHKIVIKI